MSTHRSYFAVIPASVRYDDKLIPSAKLLYGEITALSNERGYCWASNDYFAGLYGVSKTTIKNWLKSLEDNNHIVRKVKYKNGSKEIESRFISISPPRQENLPTSARKLTDPRQENLPTPRQEICPDNNTSINNTINNTNKEEVETSPVKYSTEHFTLASKLKNNLMNDFPKEMQKADIGKWADVIRLMNEKDNHTIEQIDYVLNWLPTNSFWFGNIRSAKKLRDKFETLKFEIKKETAQTKARKQFIREEQLPDRFVNPEPEPEVDPKRQAEINAKVQAYLSRKKGKLVGSDTAGDANGKE